MKEDKDIDIDFNQFKGRVKNSHLPKLLSELVRNHKGKQSPGWIYVYHKEGDDLNVMKVGRTLGKVGVNKRLNQWQRKCNQKLFLIRKWFCLKHQICEQMIHLELKLNGYWCGKRKCICKGTHKEFFRANEQTLMETVDFWVDYFNHN